MQIKMIWFGEDIPAQNQECVDHNKNLADTLGIPFELYHDKTTAKLPMYESELLRYQWASEVPDLLYVDCDVKLKYIPEFTDTTLPYFHWYESPEMTCFVSGIFYVNNCCQFFKDILAEAKARKFTAHNGWAQALMYDRYGVPKKLNRFDQNSFEHYMFSYNKGVKND